jgi:Na+-driven multidrug efflux pump
MNFKSTVTIQGINGIIASVILFMFPDILLKHISLHGNYDALTIHVFRIMIFFVIILCFMLLSVRNATDTYIQKNIMRSNMLFDMVMVLYIVYLIQTQKIAPLGGYIFGAFMSINALSYIPCYLKLK